jgi:hypothetical protein
MLPLSVVAKKDSIYYQERLPSSERMEELREEGGYERFFKKEKDEVGERSIMTQIRTFLDEYFFGPLNEATGPNSYLRYILIVLGIGLLLLYFYKNGAANFLRSSAVRQGADAGPVTALDLEEEGPLRKARNAEKEEAWVEALRWRYIYIIQTLGQKGLIRKSPHRTDREYYGELRGTGLEEDFLKLSNFFQLVRYGNRSLKERDYEDRKEDFKEMERRIKQYEG